MIPARTSVHEREAVANQKVEIGRFEGDLTFHKGNQSANIGCMVDKKSQKVFLVKNASKRTSSVTTGIFSKDEVYPRKG